MYLEGINLSKGNPTATIEFDIKGASGIRKVRRTASEGYSLFANSGDLAEYKNGYTISRIDGRDSSIEFTNGLKLFAGDVVGAVSEDQLRRIQIRETILSHIEQERRLFHRGIKVLSLFFIDEVAKYRQYSAAGKPFNGVYADMFEQEYREIVSNLQLEIGDSDEYLEYLSGIDAGKTHDGYFSIDKKSNRMIDSKLGDRQERTSDDADAYDLIMKDKERLLDRREPVRFIFSHSALREGWDNPNVFQICTLKQSGSDVRKRQEVGRGLRLAVNQNGERMDSNILGEDVHNVNVLTVIANESYDSFARGLQTEIAEAVADRPRMVTADLFKGKVVQDASGIEREIDSDLAQGIYEGLIASGYVKKGVLTDKYYEDKKNGNVQIAEEAVGLKDGVVSVLDSIYNSRAMQLENARKNNVELKLDKAKLGMPEFKKLWDRINAKSVYVVDFEQEELVGKAVLALNQGLRVSKVFIKIEKGSLDSIGSKEDLLQGTAFRRSKSEMKNAELSASSAVKYDLIGKIVVETGLTRKAVVSILCGIDKAIFDQFATNPEEFILKASQIINEQKATAIIQHITYDKQDAVYDTSIFTEPSMKGQLGVNAMAAKKHLYDYILYDSANERNFAESIDASSEVAIYVKLPSGFYISTPVGRYNPDWAIAFHQDNVKHVYFVARDERLYVLYAASDGGGSEDSLRA